MARRGGGPSRQHHRPAPAQGAQRAAQPATVSRHERRQQHRYAAREYTVLGRLWNRITGLFRRKKTDEPERIVRPRHVIREGRRRPGGIETCGGTVPGGCHRPQLPGRVHCHKHAPQHLRRLRARAHRRRVRAQKQRTR